MTTTKSYDYLNRPTQISSQPSAAGEFPISFAYQINDANQRTRATHADGSYWAYEYDELGQITSGKKYWEDGTPVAGQQFEYAYDDIGNRTATKEGGDASGGNLRSASYTANLLNQYTNRTASGTVDLIGIAKGNAAVTVNDQSTYRRGEYYQAAIPNDNSSAILYPGYTNQAILSGETNTTIGNLLIPKTPQNFWYDSDGNALSDGVWTNIWDAENRMAATENTSGVPSGGRAKETWTFDDRGRWVQRVVATWSGGSYTPQYTNRFVWDGNVLTAILSETPVIKASFMRGLDLSGTSQEAGGVGGVVAVSLQTNGMHFCVYDGNGNIMALVSGAGGSGSGSYEYDPFGGPQRMAGSPAKENPLHFSSQFVDGVTSYSKYLHRDYGTRLGRWLSRDPLGEYGGSPLYVFVDNCPVSKIDKDGRITITRVASRATECELVQYGYLYTLQHKPCDRGYFVQEITLYIDRDNCCAPAVMPPPRTILFHIWEAFPVEAGQYTFNAPEGPEPGYPPYTDGFRYRNFPNSTGALSLNIEVKFFCESNTSEVAGWGTAPSGSINTGGNPWTNQRPGFWDGESDDAPATRSVTVDWTCCPGKEKRWNANSSP